MFPARLWMPRQDPNLRYRGNQPQRIFRMDFCWMRRVENWMTKIRKREKRTAVCMNLIYCAPYSWPQTIQISDDSCWIGQDLTCGVALMTPEPSGKLLAKQQLHLIRCSHCLGIQADTGVVAPEYNSQQATFLNIPLPTFWMWKEASTEILFQGQFTPEHSKRTQHHVLNALQLQYAAGVNVSLKGY